MRLRRYDGKVRVTAIRGERGRIDGYRIEHNDGRVDGVARPKTIKTKGEMR